MPGVGCSELKLFCFYLFDACFRVPESPRWLLEYKNDVVAASNILKSIFSEEEVEKEIAAIQTEKPRK